MVGRFVDNFMNLIKKGKVGIRTCFVDKCYSNRIEVILISKKHP